MADVVLRDEIWQSERFLRLPDNTCRLAFLRLLSEADDFGNLEGGAWRIERMLIYAEILPAHSGAFAGVWDAITNADLARSYKVQSSRGSERELVHIPRFRSQRTYVVRKVPASPWDEDERELGKIKRVRNQGIAKNLPVTSLERNRDVFSSSEKAENAPSEPVDNLRKPVDKLSTSRTNENRSPSEFVDNPVDNLMYVEQNQEVAKNVPVTLPERNPDVIQGVGVGVGVGVGEKRSALTYPQKALITTADRSTTSVEVLRRRGAVSKLLREAGVQVTSQDPRLIEWVSAGVQDAQLDEAVERARLHKPSPQPIPAAYLAPVLSDVMAGKRRSNGGAPPWWSTDATMAAKGAEVGVTARPGESRDEFRGRIAAALGGRA